MCFNGGSEKISAASRYLNTDSNKSASYYQEDENGNARWFASDALLKVFNLAADKSPLRRQRENLMLGISADGVTHLTQNQDSKGKKKEKRYGWDLTFNAPKSVSILFALSDDEDTRQAVIKAHDLAVQSAVNEARKLIVSRSGKGGKQKIAAENLETIFSLHRHYTSRENDPHLHTHAFLYNLALCTSDKKFRTLETVKVYKEIKYLGAIYRATLASEISKIGFSVEADGESFRIAEVDRKLEQVFSQRTQQINDYLNENVDVNNKRKKATLATRKRKKKEQENLENLRKIWQSIARQQSKKAITEKMHLKQKYDRDDLIERIQQNGERSAAAIVIALQHIGVSKAEAGDDFHEILSTFKNAVPEDKANSGLRLG
jgi:conjugative relaxase-like TrwC/TraI family protein